MSLEEGCGGHQQKNPCPWGLRAESCGFEWRITTARFVDVPEVFKGLLRTLDPDCPQERVWVGRVDKGTRGVEMQAPMLHERESCSLHETPRRTAEKSPSATSILLLDSLKALSKPDGQGVEPVISLVAPGRGWDAAGGRWCISLLSDSKSLLVSASDQKPRFISHWLQESYFKIFFLHYKTPLWERGWLKRPQSWFLCLLCI